MNLGLRAIVKVRGFSDAKLWINRLVSAEIVKCHGGNCDEQATHVFWQDRAEWYPLCEAHRESGQMWTGSTNWNPTSFGINLLPDKAREWHGALPPEEQGLIKLEEYDKTDYYALLDGSPDVIYLLGDAESLMSVSVAIYPLKTGKVAYEIRHVTGYMSRYYGLIGSFDDAEDALKAAKLDSDMPGGVS